ncbi:unnamed protein product [Paramecium sonneborni]|uniref:Uncharacterized protein n=1 Tax=Paramecium sonneborni TaxID=65129 RepID=A0A8S1R6I5_9CILI|nr:unnamed protein product [Paramecium sonneborni]
MAENDTIQNLKANFLIENQDLEQLAQANRLSDNNLRNLFTWAHKEYHIKKKSLEAEIIKLNTELTILRNQNQNNLSENQIKHFQEQKKSLEVVIQQLKTELTRNQKGLFERNLKFFEERKNLIESQNSLINSLKNEQKELRNKILQQQQFICEEFYKKDLLIQIQPGYEQQCQKINQQFQDIKQQTQNLNKEICLLQQQQQNQNEDDYEELEKKTLTIIVQIDNVRQSSNNLKDIIEKISLKISQQDIQMSSNLQKAQTYIQYNIKIYLEFKKILTTLLDQSKRLYDKNIYLTKQLDEVNKKVETFTKEQDKLFNEFEREFKNTYSKDSNNEKIDSLSIDISTYYKLFKEFSQFVLASIQLMPGFKQKVGFQDQQREQIRNFNQNPQDKLQIQDNIKKFQEILKSLVNHISASQDITVLLSSSMSFLEKFLELLNPSQTGQR